MIARYATRVNGITDYFLTKLDVLSSLDTVPICVGYDVDGQRVDEMPMTQTEFHHARPVYEEMPGWWEDISGARTFDDLPRQRTRLRAAARRARGRADLVRRRRAGPGSDDRAPRRAVAGPAALTTPEPLRPCG